MTLHGAASWVGGGGFPPVGQRVPFLCHALVTMAPYMQKSGWGSESLNSTYINRACMVIIFTAGYEEKCQGTTAVSSCSSTLADL